MKAVIDKDACTGCGLCEDTCPEVFEMQDDIAVVKVDAVPEAAVDSCKQAVEDIGVAASSGNVHSAAGSVGKVECHNSIANH